MKYLISSVTIGACLLLSSAGHVFAQNPHTPGTPTGQLGTTGIFPPAPGVANCGGTAPNGALETAPTGQANNTSNNSPYNVSPKLYAGALGVGNNLNPHSNSQYDNACLHQAL